MDDQVIKDKLGELPDDIKRETLDYIGFCYRNDTKHCRRTQK